MSHSDHKWTEQIITIKKVENGWTVQVTEPAPHAGLVSNNRTFVARNVGELGELVEDLGLEVAKLEGVKPELFGGDPHGSP